jgi:ATP-dependent helicase/nuclease subunit A
MAVTAAAPPNPAQRAAADPAASVWVSASAGTGKTKVLTDRLLGLMLGGTDPARILCLTFTRAGAAEMANRLNDVLARWAILPPGALALELERLTGTMPDEAIAARARRLFARVLDVPGGVKIATIHAFCQSLLRRFPLEAGVAPEFAVVDERAAREALVEAGERVVAMAREGDRGLAEALAVVTRYAPEERFGTLMAALAGERGRLRRALAGGDPGLRANLAAALAAPAATPDALLAGFCAGGDDAALRAAAAALAEGSVKDRERGAVIARWCAAPERRPDLLADYLGAFLTDQRTIQKRLMTQAAACRAPAAAEALAGEAERVFGFAGAYAAATVLEASGALARLGGALVRAYAEAKRGAGLLDYDDLIETALALLRTPGRAAWVMFKLDGGLDHILIDEAQDTNPEQWEIVAALAEEFFAGEGAAERPRTVFAVGDAKQSIYSFQRADPHAFLAMRRHFEARIAAAQQQWKTAPLDTSFRSTEPVLQAVDAIFARPQAHDGVALDGAAIRHVAERAGQAGLVELWPPVMPEPEDVPGPATLPVDRRRLVLPRTRLAAAIAATLRHWLDSGERLPARDRPLRAGDVMVLVRRRNAFIGELLRALKQRDIAVAGADRLVLMEQLAVLDLVALGKFLLRPADDLTLAAVLKSPLFGIEEDALFDLAYCRGEASLWDRLRAAGGARPRAAAGRLAALLARADFAPPYELYAEILGAEGGRRALLEQLGPEAADPVEEFLALALAYEREHPPSLQGFLRWLEAGDSEVKRDHDARRRDEVRVMTVHGAKGLEAPIVFLADTMQLPTHREQLLWSEADGLPLWCPRAEFAVPAYSAEKQAVRRRHMEEYRRLLYVALTRAQDRLYICGWETRRPAGDASWHALCRAGLEGIAEPFAFDMTPLIRADGWTGDGLRLAAPQTSAPVREPAVAASAAGRAPPPWLRLPPPPEPEPPRPLFPSRPEGAEPATLSPLAAAGRDRFKRGLLLHRLLRALPDLPEAAREAAARRFLAAPVHGLAAAEQDEIREETLAVLADPDFAPLFGPASQGEVPVTGLVRGHALSGQIDRLVVSDREVLIVDYKTLRPPPANEAAVPAIYLRQLALYREALVQIYPGREIRCALLWTEGPRLMPLAPERLLGHLP